MLYKKFLKSEVLKSAGIYTATSVINKAIPFLLIPILTMYLTPSDYGVLSMFGSLVTVITPFIGLTLYSAVSRVYFDQNEIDIKEYIFNVLLITFISTIVFIFIFVFFSRIISKVSSVPVKFLWMAIVISLMGCISQIVLTLWQVQIKPFYFGTFQILNALLNAGLCITFVVFMRKNWVGNVYAQLISTFIFFIISLTILWKSDWLKIKFNKKYTKHALKYGVSLIPHALGGVLMTLIDRLFITNMVGVTSTGLYTVGYQIGSIIGILALSVNQAYLPWLYSKLKMEDYNTNRNIVRKTYLYFIALLILSAMLSLFAPVLLKVFVSKEFAGSGAYVFWIALGYAFTGMYYMISGYIFYTQRTIYISIITLSLSALYVLLNYFFVKSKGAIGAAQATTILFFLRFVFTWILASKVYKMPWIQAIKRNY